MKDIEDLMRDFLLADSAITDLVGQRIEPAPPHQAQTSFPQITTQRVSSLQTGHLRQRGPGAEDPRFQIDCWAARKADAKALSRAVVNRLNGFVGDWTDTTVSPEVPHRVAVRLADKRDLKEPDVNAGYHRIVTEFYVMNRGI